MAKKQQRFTQRPTVFEPTQEEIDAVLHDVFTAMDKAEADRLAREAHALEMLEADAARQYEQQQDDSEEFWDDEYCSYCGQSQPLCDCRYAEPEIDEKDLCPCCFSPRHSCGCDGSGCEKSERAQVVEDAVREDIERHNDEKHCAAIDIDGQQVGEADIRRLIRKVQSLTSALMLSHFSLNQANADIAALQRAVAGRPVAAFTLTRKGYDSTREVR